MTTETKERVERLRAHCNSTYDVMMAFMGWDTVSPSQDYCGDFRSALIDLLERSDPDEWTDGRLREYGLVRMPCDMDGELIYAGDKVYLDPPFAYCAWTVHSVTIDKNGVHDVCLVDDDGNERWFMPNTCTHRPPVTVESVLLELVDKAIEDIANAARNEKRTYADWQNQNDVIPEYAKRLRLAEDGE